MIEGKRLWYSARDLRYCYELETGISIDEWLNKCPDNVFVRIRWQNLWITVHTPDRGIMKYNSNCVLGYEDVLKWLDRKVISAVGTSLTDSVDGLVYAEVEIGESE